MSTARTSRTRDDEAQTNYGVPSSIRSATKPLRCAIYTRVSTEHGLDMEFNSLHAQRGACEAYIKSQKHEGWMCLAGAYDDGGFSGGSLERPNLKRLMADIGAGKLDIVVVYKVDRLTRSLADFAKLIELFDANHVSFVSVTQSFNTTSSMGRLTLNVLLSFAQFEREVTGERIRDKIAASKKKGIRMGGPVPMGYALNEKKLVIDGTEAQAIRAIFAGYLAQGSLSALIHHLDETGIVTKQTLRKDGSTRGGVRFGKGALAYLLKNRVYIGEIAHKGQWYPSDHPPIIETGVFDAVQAALRRSGETLAKRRFKASEHFPLAGRIFDDRGNRMTPTVAKKNSVHYRYYVSSALAQGRHAEAGSIARVSAQEIEDTILAHLREAETSTDSGDALFSIRIKAEQHQTFSQNDACEDQTMFDAIDRVVVAKGWLHVTSTSVSTFSENISIPWVPENHRCQKIIISDEDESAQGVCDAKANARFLLRIAKARRWLDDLVTGRVLDTDSIARRESCSERSIRKNLNLAFLPPETVKAAINGTLPTGTCFTKLSKVPMVWTESTECKR